MYAAKAALSHVGEPSRGYGALYSLKTRSAGGNEAWTTHKCRPSVCIHGVAPARRHPTIALLSHLGDSEDQDSGCQSQVDPKRCARRITETKLGKAFVPIVATTAFHLQVSGPALAGVADVNSLDSDEEFITFILTSGFIVVLYLFVIPAITYNYLRLRWYRRSAAETFFQFMLVFLFFPGMLLLAPFINFRRLPKEGTEPP